MCDACGRLHHLMSEGERFNFSTGWDNIPSDYNGIYVMFEKGEFAHGGDRIVRIGTHKGDKRLKIRIRQHFEKKKKNSSIFRKNIGLCFLNRDNDTYLEIWNLDTKTKEKQEFYSHFIDKEFEVEIENKVSKYIQENISFCLLEVPTENERKCYEARMIGTVFRCLDCEASKGWFGLNSTKKKIREKGLWQERELNSEILTEEELDAISSMIMRRKRV